MLFKNKKVDDNSTVTVIEPSPAVSKPLSLEDEMNITLLKDGPNLMTPAKDEVPSAVIISTTEEDLNEMPKTFSKEKAPEINIEIPDDYDLDFLFRTLIEKGGSDLHMAVNSPPVMRISGDMVKTNAQILTQEKAEQLFLPLLTEEANGIFEKVGNIDFGHEVVGLARFRGNFMKQYYGMSAIFRVIPVKIPSIDDMKLPPVLKNIALTKRGLIIVTGPTGSGKSTTMAAMLNYINNNRKAHIITIEDPLEFTHENIKCIIDHREIGEHAKSFDDALRAAIREDPDVILVGEMRDLETISLAIKAAEMGILVFGTLHTNSAAKTIDRIIDVFPAKEQDQVRAMLSESLKGVIAQILLKTKDGKGRVAVNEILMATPALGNIIREGKISQISSIIQTGRNDGMQSMDDALVSLVKDGRICATIAKERMSDPTALNRAGITVN